MAHTSFDQLMSVIRNNVHAYIENRLRDALSTTCDERGITYDELVNQIPSIKAFTESLHINLPVSSIVISNEDVSVEESSTVCKRTVSTCKKKVTHEEKAHDNDTNIDKNEDELLTRKRAIAAGKKKVVPSNEPLMTAIATNSQYDDVDDEDESLSEPHKINVPVEEPKLIKPNKRTSNKKNTSTVNNPAVVMEDGPMKTKTTNAESSQTQTHTQNKRKGKKMTADAEVCICKGKTKAGKSCTFKCVNGAIYCKKHISATATTTTTTTTVPIVNMCDLPSDEASWLADDDDDDNDTNIGTATPAISMRKSFYPLSHSEKVYDDDEIFDDSINSDVDPDEYVLNE